MNQFRVADLLSLHSPNFPSCNSMCPKTLISVFWCQIPGPVVEMGEESRILLCLIDLDNSAQYIVQMFGKVVLGDSWSIP